ncbi:MAG: hypothetical protein IT369_09960 [Candidatus Latescibacteria bacterium]|nr:hypothetical protein [Candidatus Latescibacterota bacterium]
MPTEEPLAGGGPSLRTGITLRAVVVGGLVSLFLGVALPYTNMIIKGSLLDHNFNTPAAIFVFFVFIAVINTGLGLLKRTLIFSTSELATIYIMAMLATSIPTIGYSEYLLPILAGIYYYASPENRWAELIHPHVPRWMAPQDLEVSRLFYEGMPQGQPIPWAAWAEPLFYWTLFIVAVYWTSLCLMVILRRQWLEHEKLLYPLVQVPLDMLRDDEQRSLVKPFFRNPVMWIGFAVPFLLGSYTALHNYFPIIPGLAQYTDQGILTTQLFLFRNTTPMMVMLNLGLVGFAYLLSKDIALGLWLFFLMVTVEKGVFNMLGIQSEEQLSRFANLAGPYLAHQAMGAMIALVVSGLWMGRHHLQDVCRKAFRNDPSVDDSGEMISYRTAVWGMIVGVLVMGVWLWMSGLPWWTVPIFMAALVVVFVTLTRGVVEGGIAVIRTPLTPADFLVSGLGTSVLGSAGVVALGFTYVWAGNVRLFFMPCFANALRLAEEIKGSKRPLLWAVGLAVGASIAGSLWSVMTLSYAYGGINLHVFWFVGEPTNAGKYMATILANPSAVSVSGWMFTALGALIMGLLAYARARFVWWPLHPLGFATSGFDIMDYVWFSIFVAWCFKAVVLKYGGPGLYRSTRPFFLGLIMGQIVVAGFWLVIDYFTGVVGNQPLGGSFV